MNLGTAFIEFMPTLARAGFSRLTTEATRMGQQIGERWGEGFGQGQEKSMRKAQTSANAFTNTLAIMGAKATIAGAGIAATTPVVLQLTSALIPAAGAALALPGALLAIKVASGVVKLAVLGVGEAIETGFTGTAEEAAEALKKLPPEARQFAKSVISLKGDLDTLRGSVSNNFFEPINQSFEPLVNRYMPLAQQQLPQISSLMGQTAAEFARAATNGRLFQGVNMLLGATSKAIAIGNDNVSAMTDALGSLIQVSAGGLPRIATWFRDASGAAATFINNAKDTGKLQEWLDNGLTVLKMLGQIFVNVGSIIGSVLRASNAAGGSFLKTIVDITGQVANFLRSAQGMSTMVTVFGTLSAIGAGLRTGLGAVLPAIAEALQIIGPTVAQLSPAVGAFVAALAPLIPHFAQMASLLLKLLIPALGTLAQLMSEHTTVMRVVATVIGIVVLALKAYALGQAIAKAATIASTIATTAWTVITRTAAIVSNLWTVATYALGVAIKFAMGPIGLIILGITALIAILVLAYKNNETFRKIVDTVWKAVKVAIQAVIDWFVHIAWPNIKTAIEALGKLFEWLWKNIIVPAWTGIKIMTEVAWVAVKAIFDAYVTYLRMLGSVFTWFWQNIIIPVWLGTKFVIQTQWNLIKAIFDFIVATVRGMATVMRWFYTDIILPTWNNIKTAIQISWNLIKGIFDIIIKYLQTTFSNAWRNFKEFVANTWDGMKQVLSQGWNWIKDNVFSPMTNFITKTIPDAFSRGVSAIKSAWEKVKEAAASPVRFVVNTVLNNGIIKGFNTISGFVNGPQISPINLGFADGGVLPGYTPGRDVHSFFGPRGMQLDLSGGEAILRPELTKALGSEFIHQGNKAARTGQARNFLQSYLRYGDNAQFANGGILKFDKGGILGGIAGGLKKAWDAFTNPVDTFKSMVGGLLGGIGGGRFGDVLRNASTLLIDKVSAWITSKFNESGQAIGAAGGPGNWSAMWNWVKGKFPGAQLYSGLRNSTTLSGNRSLHADGRAIDVSPWREIAMAIRSTFGKNITELITPWRELDMWHGSPHQYSEALHNQHSGSNAHVHWAMKLGGILKRFGLYDRGGWLGAGGVAVNMSRKPEAVLTPEESIGLKAMGTDRLVDLFEELIDAVKSVAPGVGAEIRGSGRRLIAQARGV